MNIPQGYKQTELGIIPEDWEVKPIGECLSIGNGCDYKDKPFGNIPVYGTGGVITYINDYLYDGHVLVAKVQSINLYIMRERSGLLIHYIIHIILST